VDGVLFDKARSLLILCPRRKSTSLTIPNYIIDIENDAFTNCTNLTNVTISSSVSNMPTFTFSSCSSLTAIDIDPLNGSYSSMDGVLFDKSRSLLILCPRGRSGSFIIPNNVASIMDSAFSWCSRLANVTIPSTITNIGRCTFSSLVSDSAFAYCSGLTAINVDSSNANYSVTTQVVF
jgi:hypothetical protein